jgi:hypothetical protein
MCRTERGEFSIIAALLVAVILVGTVIATYSIIRNLSLTRPPNVLSSTLEMNLSLKHTLEFISGYYSSILQVTGNTTYARDLASKYLYSALLNIAFSRPDWNPSFEVNFFNVSNVWFERVSYSQAEISVTYNLSGIGTYGIRYGTSSLLNVTILDSDANQSRVLVKREENMTDLTLGLENFFFYQYDYSSSTWNLVHPDISPIAFSNGTYILQIPCGVDPTAYMVKVVDWRGMMATAFFSQSKRPQYTYTFNWDSKYDGLNDDAIAVEVLQNGALRWLDQILSEGKPIPPIPVKAFHVSVNANSTNLEEKQVPFQIEDWESNYTVPLGLSSNTTIFSNRNMIVFLINHKVENVTLWWDGRDTATQTPLAYTNKYFTSDTKQRTLSNGILNLRINFSTQDGVASFKVNSTVNMSTSTAVFMRINQKIAHYGDSEPMYAVLNGTVRAILQHEVEWPNDGISDCPNVYAHIVLTLPANATYYTYQLRLMFLNSTQQARKITDLCPIKITTSITSINQAKTENGTLADGYPRVNGTGLFYNFSTSCWQHHWSQMSDSTGTKGFGIMFTNSSNFKLYGFDDKKEFDTEGKKTGALNVSANFIEFSPIALEQVSFNEELDIVWCGAVVTFAEGHDPIYKSADSIGLWVVVEYPPTVEIG